MEREPEQYKLYGGLPPHVRHSETSKAAAVEIFKKLNRLQVKVFNAIDFDGKTDQELEEATGLIGSTVRPRRRELYLKGLIYDSGLRRKTASGRKAVVWMRTHP